MTEILGERVIRVDLHVAKTYANKYLHGNVDKSIETISYFLKSSNNTQRKLYWDAVDTKDYTKAVKIINQYLSLRKTIKNELKMILKELWRTG